MHNRTVFVLSLLCALSLAGSLNAQESKGEVIHKNFKKQLRKDIKKDPKEKIDCTTLLVEGKKSCRDEIVFGLPSKCQEAAIGLKLYTPILQGKDKNNLTQGANKEKVATMSCRAVVRRIRRAREKNEKKNLVPQNALAPCNDLATFINQECLEPWAKGEATKCNEAFLSFTMLKHAKDDQKRSALCSNSLRVYKEAMTN